MTNDTNAGSQLARSRLRCLQDISSALSALDRFTWRRSQGLSFRDLIPVVKALATAQENAGWDCDAQIHSDKRKRATQKFIQALEHFISGEEHIFIDLIYKVSESSSRKFDCCWNKIQQNPSFSERRKETAKLLSDIHLASPWRKKIQDFRDHKMTFEEAISHWDVRTVLSWGETEAGFRPGHDPRWLHYLRDNPVALRKTLETTLNSRRLSDRGRRRNWHITVFAESIADIYLDITGRKLTYGTTVLTGSDRDAGEEVPGPSLAFAKTCLNVVVPRISRDQARYRVRQMKQIRDQ